MGVTLALGDTHTHLIGDFSAPRLYLMRATSVDRVRVSVLSRKAALRRLVHDLPEPTASPRTGRAVRRDAHQRIVP